MPFRSLSPDLENMKGVVGSTLKRTRSIRLPCCWAGAPKEEAMVDNVFQALAAQDVSHDQSCWATLPSELLRNVLQRVESADCAWPARKDVVACAAVCRTWRAIIKELVKTPDESSKLTFPISLKQPGPRERVMQCFIKRDKSTSTFYLYLGLSPTTLLVENSKFLLAARKFRRASSIEYVISDDRSTGTNAFVGKLRSNFIGTKFKVLDTYVPCNGTLISTSRSSKRIGSKQVCPKAPPLVYDVAHVAYQLNVMGSRGPRRLLCTLHSVPTSAVETGSHAPVSEELSPSSVELSHQYPFPCTSSSEIHQVSSCSSFHNLKRRKKSPPLTLKNKAPRWHEQLQCWCLNFRGRVTVASVKNFQLVASIESNNRSIPQGEEDKVLLQFGKIGKDIFTMDYCYPLSAYQAFAICLTSFGTKLVCE